VNAARLAIHALACVRGGRLLFEGFDLTLGAGDAAIVRGPNGIGKSSLLRVVAGLLTPDAGSVEVSGRVALAAGALALDGDQPLARALRFWAALDRGDVTAGMSAMGLGPLADVPVRMLSTGQRRRADLARTIASGAAIWLLDEPGNGLDTAAQALLESAVAAHRAAGGIVLAATHQPLALPHAQMVRLGQ
jgi:heme exporter protein A